MDMQAIRRDATRAHILEVTWDLARRDGVAAISLRDIARRVGDARPILYTYFPSKNALYDVMFAGGAGQLAETLAQRRKGADPCETLRMRVRLLIAFCTADPVRYQLLLERPIPDFEPTGDSLAIVLTAVAGMRADLEAPVPTGSAPSTCWGQ